MSGSGVDVVVVGGGVIGCAVARELARRGVRVAVVERGWPGREASWAAAGMVSPLSEARRADAFFALALASAERFPAFARAVEEESGVDVGHRSGGKLGVALDDEEAAALADAYAWQSAAGHPVEWLEAGEVRRLEPALAPEVRAGLWWPRDQQVDSRRLGRALWIAAARAGAEFLLGVAAVAVWTVGPEGRARVAGVELPGRRLAADRVVVAAGSWSGGLRGLPRPLPVRPVRGQMMAVEAVPPLLGRTVLAAGCYLIPWPDGRLVIGATVEDAGFHPYVTPEGLRSLAAAAVRAVPGVAGVPVLETWAGLRPGTPDDLPVLGPDPEVEGLCYATGHFRNGILLAPITAECVADVVEGKRPAVALDAFRPDRFGMGGAA